METHYLLIGDPFADKTACLLDADGVWITYDRTQVTCDGCLMQLARFVGEQLPLASLNN